MDEFDTGSGWQDGMDAHQKEFYEAMNLNDGEQAVVKEIHEAMKEVASKFTFWKREQQANPKTHPVQFKINLKGETLERYMWLRLFVVQGGWETMGDVLNDIITMGIAATYMQAQQGHAANAMQMEMLRHMPIEVQRATMVNKMRAAIKARQETADKAMEESLE